MAELAVENAPEPSTGVEDVEAQSTEAPKRLKQSNHNRPVMRVNLPKVCFRFLRTL